MKENIKKLNNLSDKRIDKMIINGGTFYKGHQTYVDAMLGEIEEVKEELKDNNSVHLEDELGDVLWTYICLLNSLKKEGLITSVEKVFERSYKKYSGRLNPENGENNGIWEEVKKMQNLELRMEHNKKFK